MSAPQAQARTPALAGAWLSVVGINEDGLAGLGEDARKRVEEAELLVGGERHLAMVPDLIAAERMPWPSPLTDAFDALERARGRRVCVLATGDPYRFGVAGTLARRFSVEEMRVIPAPSAFALACARLGWSQPDTAALTVHGRAIESLHPHIQPGARLLVLCNDGATPAAAARLLKARGFGPSVLTVLEHMGGAAEARTSARATNWGERIVADFATLAVECAAERGAALLPAVPGLPDAAYAHDGQLTKRAVRAATLALLGPVPGQLLWDIGAGCGSIGIEWMRAARGACAVAVERSPDRIVLIERNRAALGTPGLEIVSGEAPAAFEGLPQPDAVFVGGGTSDAELVPACLAALAPGGRLVANAVTVEGETSLATWHAREGGELSRHAISHAQTVGPFRGFRPAMAVTQWSYVKP